MPTVRHGAAAERDQVEGAVEVVVAELEVIDPDCLGPIVVGRAIVAKERVVEPLPDPPGNETAKPPWVPAQDPRERIALLVEQLHVARRPEQPEHVDVGKRELAQATQLAGVELHVVVGVDDLVREAECQTVGRHECRHAILFEHASGFANRPFGVGDVLQGLHRNDRCEGSIVERQVAHVRHDRLPALTRERLGVDVDPDGFTRCQHVIAVADAATEIQNLPRAQPRLARRIRSHVALPGGVEATGGGDHPLAGDLHLKRSQVRASVFSGRQRNVARRERRRSEEPALDRETGLRHARVGARLVEVHAIGLGGAVGWHQGSRDGQKVADCAARQLQLAGVPGAPVGRLLAAAFFQGRAQAPQRPRQDLLDVGKRQPGELGDFGPGHVAAVAQRDQLALAVAQAAQRLRELGLRAEDRIIGQGAGGGKLALVLVRERPLLRSCGRFGSGRSVRCGRSPGATS